MATGGSPEPRPVGTRHVPDPKPGRRRVEVPVAALAALVSALLAALLLIAYLAGREAGRNRLAAAPVAAPLTTPSEAPPSTPSPPPATDSTLPTRGAAPPYVSEPSAGPEPAPLPVDGDREAVVLYFQALDSFEQQAEYWDDPQELAMSLMSQMTSGDSSGFDRLVEAQRQAERGLVSMAVPAPCREHHERTLALLREAVGLLTSVRSGVAAGDLQVVMGAATRARSLETEARELEGLAEALKQRYRIRD